MPLDEPKPAVGRWIHLGDLCGQDPLRRGNVRALENPVRFVKRLTERNRAVRESDSVGGVGHHLSPAHLEAIL